MGNRRILTIVLLLAMASLILVGCDASRVLSQFGVGTSSKPTVSIQSPRTASQFKEGDDITVQSTARDSMGIVRVELAVDGAAVRTDAPPVPQGQTVFTLVQTWKAVSGNHTLSVRAFNASGVASDPDLITVVVASSQALAPSGTMVPSATATLLGPSTPVAFTPQPSLTGTLSITGTPTVRATTRPAPTRTLTPTIISGPPGVYALSIRVDPPRPYRKTQVNFFVTFYNTSGAPQDYRWRINVYRPDQLIKPMGDTQVVGTTIAPGQQELASANNWGVYGPGDCEDFVARVFWVNTETKEQIEFTKPNGAAGPSVQFTVCP